MEKSFSARTTVHNCVDCSLLTTNLLSLFRVLVCVHSGDSHHIPGYFNIRVHKFGDPDTGELATTLIVTWIPNRYIERHRTITQPNIDDNASTASPYRSMIGLCRSTSSSPIGPITGKISRRQSVQSICSITENTLSPVNPNDVMSALAKVNLSNRKVDGNSSGDPPPLQPSPVPTIRLECPYGPPESTPLGTPCQTPRRDSSNSLKGIFTVDLRQMKSLR